MTWEDVLRIMHPHTPTHVSTAIFPGNVYATPDGSSTTGPWGPNRTGWASEGWCCCEDVGNTTQNGELIVGPMNNWIYWLASGGFSAHSGAVEWSPAQIQWGTMIAGGSHMFFSTASEYFENGEMFGIRPVIVLNSNFTLEAQDGSVSNPHTIVAR